MIIEKIVFPLILILPLAIIAFSFKWQDTPLEESMDRGQEVYLSYCITCHMENGQGILGAFPPLANSDYLMADRDRAIKIILNGLSEEITVNGMLYFGEMMPQQLTDRQVADVLNYVMNSWGNTRGEIISDSVVAKTRD